MPTLTNDSQNTDDQNNVAATHARELFDMERKTGNDAGVNAGIDQAEQFANDPNNASKNIREANEKEQARAIDNQFGYNKSDAATPRGKRKFSLKATLTGRKAATGGIIGSILALVGAISFIATPGLAAVQLKEILTDDLNDQLTAMDKRSVYVMRGKLNDLGKGVCTGVKIRCGFKGMSDRQINKFKAAGFEVETDGKVFGRNHVTSLTITDSNGNKIVADNPRELNRALGDRAVRNSLRKAFNPKFAGFFDAKWDNFKSRFNLTSSDKIGAGSEEDKRAAVTSAAQGEPINPEAPGKLSTTDPDGNPDPDADKANSEIDRVSGSVGSGGVPTSSVLEAGSTGAIKGLGVLGAADVACSVKNTARAVEAGAKIYRYKQLMAYSMVFLTFADSIKAGTATPDQAEFVGNTLTAVDTREMIVTEDSIFDESGNDSKVKNPYYGANAFDSAGYKTAMYNDAPTLSARDAQMSIGGGLALGMLAKVNSYISQYGGDNCKLIQNWGVRGGSIVIGIILGVATVGTSLAFSMAGSVAISMALPILENYLAQMIAGTVADGNTTGVDTGNAMFAGSAALMGGMAMARGMKPATKEDMKSYLAATDEVQNEYIAMETEEASKTPFDINNRYSFLGSFARTLLPARTTSSISVGNSISNTFSVIANSILTPPSASAKNGYSEERFSKCADEGYSDIGIDADIFCNVRFVMSEKEMNMDTEAVRLQMLAWGQVNDDEEGTVVPDSDYEKWLEECTVRTDVGWGETTEENNSGTGINCMNSSDRPDDNKGQSDFGDDNRLSHFRVYTMDSDIIAAMDYEPPVSSSQNTAAGVGASFNIASFNIYYAQPGDAWSGRLDRSINVINSKQIDVAGLQEVRPNQFEGLKNRLTSHDSFPKNYTNDYGSQNPIIWNSSKFKLVEGKFISGSRVTQYGVIPDTNTQVLLETNEGQRFYVINSHESVGNGGAIKSRYDNAIHRAEYVKNLREKDNYPVFLTADWNTKYNHVNPNQQVYDNKRENSSYCILTRGGLTWDAFDASKNKTGECPTSEFTGADVLPGLGPSGPVDRILMSPEVSVTKFDGTATPPGNGSDSHNTIVASVTIPGEGGGALSGDLAWPVDKKYFDQNRYDFLKPHFAGSGTWTNGVDSLAADIGSPPDGSNVYAMLGGTVSKSDLGGHGLAIKSDVQGGVVEIAYAHGPRANKNTSYNAGDKIMEVGELGNVTGGHLHLDISFTPTGGTKKGICPQDLFLAMDKGESVNWKSLSERAQSPCSGRG